MMLCVAVCGEKEIKGRRMRATTRRELRDTAVCVYVCVRACMHACVCVQYRAALKSDNKESKERSLEFRTPASQVFIPIQTHKSLIYVAFMEGVSGVRL